MKRKIALFTIATLILLSSCKKETALKEGDQEIQQSGRSVSVLPQKNGRTLSYKATKEVMDAQLEAFKQKVRAGKDDNIALRPGVCPSIASSSSYVLDVYGSECVDDDVEVTFRFMILRQWSVNYLDYSFDIATMQSSYNNGTITYVDTEEACWAADDFYNDENGCYQMDIYNVVVLMDAGEYENNSTTTNTVDGECSVPGYPLQTDIQYPTLDFTSIYYSSQPALLSVTGSGINKVFIGTDCSLICPSNHTICPSGGQLIYWKTNNPSVTGNINYSAYGGFYIVTLGTGAYSYSAVNAYTYWGSPTVYSQTKYGTFNL
jgi:hypothetical protein